MFFTNYFRIDVQAAQGALPLIDYRNALESKRKELQEVGRSDLGGMVDGYRSVGWN